MIEVTGLTKRYGKQTAVDHISFHIGEGEIVGFLGRNGAGKTTTMNMLTGYISATSGTVKVDGYDLLTHPLEVKKRIGYLPEQPPLYTDMTVRDYLLYAAALKGVVRARRQSHVEEVAQTVGVYTVLDRVIGNLSKGYRQRVGFSQALIGNPPVIILDEPTVGLDPKQILGVRKLIRQLGKNHTLIISSHILSEIAEVCDRVMIINRGRTVAQDTVEALTRGTASRLTLCAAGQSKMISKAIGELPGVKKVTVGAEREPGAKEFLIETDGVTDVRRTLTRTLAKLETPILHLSTADATLEDIFLNLTDNQNLI